MVKKEIDIICEKCKKVYSKGMLDKKDYKENYAYGICKKCSKKD